MVEGTRIGAITLGSRDPDIPPDLDSSILGLHHGKGYATEAAEAVVSYILKTLL